MDADGSRQFSLRSGFLAAPRGPGGARNAGFPKSPRMRAVRPDLKRCPECGEDFLPHTEMCSDCGVPLRLASELPEDGGPEGLPDISALVLIRAEGPAWIEALAGRLRADGIPSRVEIIDPERHGARSGLTGSACGLFVREEDAARARAIDAEVEREQIPDLPSEGDTEAGEDACPACGTATAGASECPDCGLFLG